MMINVDVQQMEQVLINILKNAMKAIDEESRITIRSFAKPAKLIIQDTGAGVSPEASVNLFSPFYSTKKGGQGVGLTVTREILLITDLGFADDYGGLEDGVCGGV